MVNHGYIEAFATTGIWMIDVRTARNKSKSFALFEKNAFHSGKWPVNRINISTSKASVKANSILSVDHESDPGNTTHSLKRLKRDSVEFAVLQACATRSARTRRIQKSSVRLYKERMILDLVRLLSVFHCGLAFLHIIGICKLSEIVSTHLSAPNALFLVSARISLNVLTTTATSKFNSQKLRTTRATKKNRDELKKSESIALYMIGVHVLTSI
jgi:hypothetical protein